jgi:hypothetical protein
MCLLLLCKTFFVPIVKSKCRYKSYVTWGLPIDDSELPMQETPNAIDVGLKWISPTFYEQIFCLFPISKNLQTQIVRTEKLPKTILHEEAAHKTFLQAPFVPIFLRQKITKPNLSRGKLCKTILHEKGARKMLVILTPAVNFINVKRTNFSYESRFFTCM